MRGPAGGFRRGRLCPGAGRAWMREARRTKNPLLRRADLAEWAVAVLAGAVLVGLGIAVVALSWSGYAGALARKQAAQRSRISATVQARPGPMPIGSAASLPASALVRYAWHGVNRVGMAPLPSWRCPVIGCRSGPPPRT